MPVQTSAAQVVYYAQFDTAPALVALLTDGAGNPVDLTGASVTIRIAYGRYSYFYSPTRAIVDDFPCFVTDALAGEVEYRPAADHLDPPGEFQYTFEVTYPDLTRQTFPPNTYLPLIIRTRVGGRPGSPGNP